MNIFETLFGKKDQNLGKNPEVVPLNVNVVTAEGRVVGVPQPSGELPVLVNLLTPFFREDELTGVVLEYLSHSPEAPAHSLSADTVQLLQQGIAARRKQQQIARNVRFRQPTRLDRMITAFRMGQEDSEVIHLIKQSITNK